MEKYGHVAAVSETASEAITKKGDLATILHRLESLRDDVRGVRLEAATLKDRLFGPTPQKTGGEKSPSSVGGFHPTAQMFIDQALAEVAEARVILNHIVRSLE